MIRMVRRLWPIATGPGSTTRPKSRFRPRFSEPIQQEHFTRKSVRP